MKPPSFETPSNNPYIRESESEDEPLDAPKKKESKKEKRKDRKHKGDKKHEEEKEKKPKKSNEDDESKEKKSPKKATKKEKKEESDDEEALEEKKQKRQSLVERSLNFKKLYEEMPVPRDPRVVARLMVAEHILAIQAQIEQPAPDATPLDEFRLLASLDYMGTIADTLENPDIETTPEMKETCETLVQLAQEALEEGDEATIETLIQANNDSAQTFEAEPSEETVHNPHVDAASSNLPISGAALLAVLTYNRQHPQQQPLPTNPIPYTATSTAGKSSDSTVGFQTKIPSTPSGQTAPPLSPPAPGDGHPAPPIHAPRRDTPLVTPERRPTPTEVPPHNPGPFRGERHSSPSLRRPPESLAALAVAAAAIHDPHVKSFEMPNKHSSSSISHHYANTPEQAQINYAPTPVRTPSPRETFTANNPSQIHHPIERPYTSPLHSTPPSRIETNSAPHLSNTQPTAETISQNSQKIEHLPLVSLLAMAETVSIGHGQRLRSAYEKGTIDKEGLVKILKSHAKHHDFIHEYKQQVVKHRNLVQSSPEFLTPSQPQKDTNMQATDSPASAPAKVPASNDFQADTNITDFMPTTDLPRPQEQPAPIDFFDTPDEKIFHPTWLVPVLIGVLIIAAGALLAFLMLR